MPTNARTPSASAATVSQEPTSVDRSRQTSATGPAPSSMAKPPIPAGAAAKKTTTKKTADPVNTRSAIEDTIAQLERNKAGEKDQEIEIEREVKKANRDLSALLANLETPLARLETVQKKYTELLADMKRTEREHIKAKKRADHLQKEKDSSRQELTKANTRKDALEKLCRELQLQNKKLKDDNKKIGDTETRMREELHQRLEGMALDVQEVIDEKENPENLPVSMETDEMFRQKFKSFIDQYELRELQFHSLLRTKELEVQYQMARFEQQRKAQEQEASKSRQLTTQVSTFSQTETELRSQLNIYVEKFKQVEDTLNNSNDLFLTFRKEMEEMSKKTKRLEKENNTLTRKHDSTSHNILQMAEERTRINRELDLLRRKNDNLERLCRGMQAQGRSQANMAELELEEEGTESEYEYDEDDDGGSEDVEYDEDTEEEAAPGNTPAQPSYGPVPPPPPPLQNARPNGVVNGVNHQVA